MLQKDKPSGQTYHNVMEMLVQEEIEVQLEFYPKNLKSYFNIVEVATYALNRLPPLYASSMEGVEQQKRIGKKNYKEQITSAVRRALAAIERDPLRHSTPLISELEKQYEIACSSLQKLETFLREANLLDVPSLSWKNLTISVQRALYKVRNK